MYNKILQQQIEKYYGDLDKLPEELLPVFKAVSSSYDGYAKDQKMVEESLEIVSFKMIALNENLRVEKEDLREALSDLKMLFENVSELLYSMDMITPRFTKMADVCEKIYGYPASDFFAEVDLWRRVIHPHDQHLSEEGHEQLLQGKPAFNQYRIIHKDGSIRWLDNKVMPTMNKEGKLVRIDGISSDITHRKNVELELAKSVSLLEATLNSTADGILVADLHGKIVSYNKKFLTLWNMPADVLKTGDDEKAIEFVLDQLIDPEDFVAKIKELYKQQNEISFDVLRFKDGRTFERYSQPQLINGEVVGRVWSFRDISECEKAEEALEIKNKELEAKNKELEQFVYIASHDLQEPLRTSISFIQLIKKQYEGKLDSTADKYFDFISGASERMKVLISDLLDYSRIGKKGAKAPIDCAALVAEVLQDIDAAIKETSADIDIYPLPVVHGYPTELKQVFQNLLINAIKFQKKNTPPQITIKVQKQPAAWEFSLQDNGIGIGQQHHERIFVIFQRLHARNEYQGSGIGLSHCKKIIELHGGKIWLTSVPDEGSTFYFTIPQS